MGAESGSPADLLCSIAFPRGPGNVRSWLHTGYHVLTTARSERARFCSEQTLHH